MLIMGVESLKRKDLYRRSIPQRLRKDHIQYDDPGHGHGRLESDHRGDDIAWIHKG